MNYSDYITSTHSGKFIAYFLLNICLFIEIYIGPIDYHGYSIPYRSQNLLINQQSVHQAYRPRSLTRVSESSSGIEIIDEETTETYSSDSEFSIIRYHSPSSSSSLSSRRVVINSTDQIVTISNKRQRRRRRRRRNRQNQWKKSSTEKKSFDRNYSSQHSSKYKHQHSSSGQRDYKEDRLKHLFDKYSSEGSQKEWKPLTFLESQELYQYAADKYYKKLRYN